MIALLQRVTQAHVAVGGDIIAEINGGLLVLLGVEKGDSEQQAHRLVQRVCAYRVFEDDPGRMNKSLLDVQGDLLLVPQFTLAADTNKGMRPSFSSAAPPEQGRQLFEKVVACSRDTGLTVGTGAFGADMKVALVNDGPVTFWLQVN